MGGAMNSKNESSTHVTENILDLDVINHPAFEGFGQFILPGGNSRIRDDMRLDSIDWLLPYHNHIDPSTTLGVINHMIDEVNEGRTIFYDFYTEEQKGEDPSKESNGLFFFRSEPGKPFAMIRPGGGFSYVGSIHEGFPYAWVISKKGYNAFVIQYRRYFLKNSQHSTFEQDEVKTLIFSRILYKFLQIYKNAGCQLTFRVLNIVIEKLFIPCCQSRRSSFQNSLCG